MIEVFAPPLGLPVSAVVKVSSWLASTGESVLEGDRLVELLIDEITFDVPSPATGRLSSIKVGVDRRVQPGMVLGCIQPDPDAV